LIAVIRLFTPPEALKSATSKAMMALQPSADRLRLATWSEMSVRTSCGSAVSEFTCSAITAGSAKNPYRVTSAITAGNNARKA
jgi:hypothetical protein